MQLKKSRVVARATKTGLGAQIVSPTPDPCQSPKIELVAAEPPLEPGDTVYLNGCGFGAKNTNSRLMLVGNDFYSGFLDLQIDKWLGYYIEATVPAVSNVKDMPGAKLQIRTGDFKLSSSTPMAFKAARDVVKLNRHAVQLSCAPGAGAGSKCPGHFSYTFGALHDSGDKVYYIGTDSAKVKLINNYVLAGYWWTWDSYSIGFVNFPDGVTPGISDLNILMSFVTVWPGAVDYGVDLWAEGPKGVKYH